MNRVYILKNTGLKLYDINDYFNSLELKSEKNYISERKNNNIVHLNKVTNENIISFTADCIYDIKIIPIQDESSHNESSHNESCYNESCYNESCYNETSNIKLLINTKEICIAEWNTENRYYEFKDFTKENPLYNRYLKSQLSIDLKNYKLDVKLVYLNNETIDIIYNNSIHLIKVPSKKIFILANKYGGTAEILSEKDFIVTTKRYEKEILDYYLLKDKN